MKVRDNMEQDRTKEAIIKQRKIEDDELNMIQ
jgi:hypothetical protein